MEDGVIEAERLLHPKTQRQEQNEAAEKGDANSSGGGLLKQIVSNLVSKVESESESETENGNGILNNIIGHIVSPLSPKEEGSKTDDEVKSNEEQGGGLLDNIISHFPTSLPEDAAPTTDEASILIHSIVHD